jgi:hypothetical protein
MKEWKRIIADAGYVPTKNGLVSYLDERNKLPFICPFWSEKIKYYRSLTITELLKYMEE